MVDDSDKIKQLDQTTTVLATTQSTNVAKITDIDNKRKSLNAIGARLLSIDSAISNINVTITSLGTAISEAVKDPLVNTNVITALNHAKTIAEQEKLAMQNIRDALSTIVVNFAGNGG